MLTRESEQGVENGARLGWSAHFESTPRVSTVMAKVEELAAVLLGAREADERFDGRPTLDLQVDLKVK